MEVRLNIVLVVRLQMKEMLFERMHFIAQY